MKIQIVKVTRKNEVMLKLIRPYMKDEYFLGKVGEEVEFITRIRRYTMDFLSTDILREYGIEV